MVTSAPQDISNEIILEIAALYTAGESRDFLAAKISREIEKIKKNNAASAYMLKGMLESVLWNPKEAKINFEKAIFLDSSYIVLHNYALAMKKLSYFELSLSLYERALSKNPADKDVVLELIDVAILLGKTENIRESIAMHCASTAKNSSAIERYYEKIISLINHVDQKDFHAINRNIINIVIDNKKDVSLLELVKLPEEYNKIIIQVGVLHADSDLLYKMNDELNTRNCLDKDLDISSSLVNGYFVACKSDSEVSTFA